MIWMTWRQFRIPALTTGALLLVVLAGLVGTWAQVTHAASVSGYAGCQGDACAAAAETFLQSLRREMGSIYIIGILALFLLPSLVGIFWGAPLVARELETGTYRMVFSQSVGRGRWLLVKLVVGGGAAVLGAGLLSLVLTRWAQQIDAAQGDRITPMVYAARGIVPIGYAALAFVAGVTAGLLLRRTMTAMVATLLVVAGLQLAAPFELRPWLARPVTSVTALDPDEPMGIGMDRDTNEMRIEPETAQPGAWVLSSSVVTPAGDLFRGPADITKCGPEAPGGRETCVEWLRAKNLSQRVTYVPGSQFWALQWREFGVLIALTGILSLFALWWIRRRLV